MHTHITYDLRYYNMQYCAHPYLEQLCSYLRQSFLIILSIRGSVHILS